MKSLILISLFLFSTFTQAKSTLHCEKALGESVYSSFTLEFRDGTKWGYYYDLSEMAASELILDGVMNENHEDNDDIGEDWTFVTLGKRVTTIKDESHDYDFYMDTCKDCDFNGASYRYENSGEGEIFITEMYGSDGSAEFSVYKCSL